MYVNEKEFYKMWPVDYNFHRPYESLNCKAPMILKYR